MAETKQQTGRREPAGFTPRTSRLASEHAREQGWEINEEQRVRTQMEKQKYDGGLDYDYGGHDFGDETVNSGQTKPGKRLGNKT
jgi:hypothetical protein